MELIGTRETAQRLGYTKYHVARLVRDGKLAVAAKAPGVRGAFLFDAQEIEALAKERGRR